jgi:hypothetical protein
MSDASFTGDAGPDSSAPAGETLLVQFANDTEAFDQANESAPSEWAFAAHEAVATDGAIDALSDFEQTLMPWVAVASFVAVEIALFADAGDVLITTTLTPDLDNGGSAMWSGEDTANNEAIEPIQFMPSESGIVLHEAVVYGVSVDWTDAVSHYS